MAIDSETELLALKMLDTFRCWPVASVTVFHYMDLPASK